MKVTPEIAALIARLEYEIGRECYNQNSYDGYTGIEGAAFRYPVTVYQDGDLRKYRYIIPAISPDEINTMKYVFGSKHLFIGNGICNILNMLEKRYGIDFSKMEDEIKKE